MADDIDFWGTLFLLCMPFAAAYVLVRFAIWKKRQKQYDDIENMCRGAASAGAKRGGRG